MQRRQLITLHLYAATFLIPFIFIMSLSGVLELLDVKGKMHKDLIYSSNKNAIDFKSKTIKQDIKNMLITIGVNADFKRLKIKNNKLYTLPNYTTHYAFKKNADDLKVYEYTPSIQLKLMSLHKGNGPTLYKLYQQIFVYGLFFVLLSGLWLGLTSAALRFKTILVLFSGIAFYLLLINY